MKHSKTTFVFTSALGAGLRGNRSLLMGRQETEFNNQLARQGH